MKKLLTLALMIVFLGCKKDKEPDNKAVLPSNLVVTLDVSVDDPGRVTAKATASNANFYTFIFNEGSDSTVIESAGGEEEYTYSTEGDFIVRVRANTTAAEYIAESKTVNITFNRPDLSDTSGYSTPLSYPNLTLVWNDEFNGNQLNTSDWNFEIGTGNNGWGNAELQYYLQENVSVNNGFLTIEAKQQVFNTNQYTSSRITTEGKQSFQYGRIDIRAKLPYSKGIWPALWMLGDNFSTIGWPRCGEIDIMELVGGNVAGGGDDVVHGTIHWDNGGVKADVGGSYTLDQGIFANKFHVFTLIWNSNELKWYVDDTLFFTVDITPADLEEFHQKFFFIFNVAVGGNWPGSPDATSVFPQKMIVDYVRVFQ